VLGDYSRVLVALSKPTMSGAIKADNERRLRLAVVIIKVVYLSSSAV